MDVPVRQRRKSSCSVSSSFRSGRCSQSGSHGWHQNCGLREDQVLFVQRLMVVRLDQDAKAERSPVSWATTCHSMLDAVETAVPLTVP
jgi:hypothetical protein